MSLAALIQGVFYQDDALQQAWELVADWSDDELEQTWHHAHKYGVTAPMPDAHSHVGRRTLLELAREFVDLCILAPSDAQYLQPLIDLLEGGKSEGELAAELFDGDWKGSMKQLSQFARCSKIEPSTA